MTEASNSTQSAQPTQPAGGLKELLTALTNLLPPTTADWWLGAVRKYARLWIGVTVAMTAAALVFAIFRPDSWRASQAIVVREEAIGSLSRQGRFDTADGMKAAQETILEIARSQAVVEAALRQAGPPVEKSRSRWPAANDVRSAQASLQVSAPKGAEFGRTEMIYVSMKARQKERAAQLTLALCDQLETRLKNLRGAKAQSVINELTRTAAMAEADLAAATKRLETLESEVGSDLGELRTLNDSGVGDSNLRLSLNQVKNALSAARAAQADTQKQLEILIEAKNAPEEGNGVPNKLLETQPALRRLKEGLVDAQLRTSQLMGTMHEQHPLVQAAIAAENEVKADWHAELTSAVQGMRADLRVNEAHIASLETQYGEVTERLNRLAGLRARYGNLAAEVRNRSEILEKARRDLADARAAKSAAQSASLLSRVDGPVIGDYPEGPRRSMIVLAGLVGGLFTGFGLVFLLAPRNDGRGRRFTDRFGSRRNHEAAAPGRRADDRSASTSAPAPTAAPAPAPVAVPVPLPLAVKDSASEPPLASKSRRKEHLPSAEPASRRADAPARIAKVRAVDDPECQYDPAWVAAASTAPKYSPHLPSGKRARMSLTQTLRKLAVEK